MYRQARRTMLEELGIKPSERLRRLERAILSDDPARDPSTAPIKDRPVRQRIPGLLPADIADFTSRGAGRPDPGFRSCS